MIRIHNSLTGEKQELKPVEPGHVRMYSCGITVYDYFHVGNARMLVVFDMVSRYLRHRGLRVTYVRNITDVDDKIINRAQRGGRRLARARRASTPRPCTRISTRWAACGPSTSPGRPNTSPR